MKNSIMAALLCAPITVHATYFTQETVSFDDAGKPIIKAQLMRPPITSNNNVETDSSLNLFDDDSPMTAPTVTGPNTQKRVQKPTTQAESLVEANLVKARQALARAKRQAKEAARLKAKRLCDQSEFVITKGSTYHNALSSWLDTLHKPNKTAHQRRSKYCQIPPKKPITYRGVTWHLSPETLSSLNTIAEDSMTFNPNITQSINELGALINTPLQLIKQRDNRIALITDKPMDLHWVAGKSLKSAVKTLTTEMGWKWVNEGALRSWLAQYDYPFSQPYPLISEKDDIADALDKVLEGYPLQAKLLRGTRTVLITDK